MIKCFKMLDDKDKGKGESERGLMIFSSQVCYQLGREAGKEASCRI